MSTDDKYPRGMFNSDDEGVLAFTIGTKDNTIVIDFGKPVAWIGLPKPQAVALAFLLLRRAGTTRISVELPDDFPIDEALKEAMRGGQ